MTLDVGEEGKLSLEGINFRAPGLSAWTIDIHFDPGVVQEFAPPPLLEAGTARLSGASALGRQGDFELVSLTFKCLAVGESRLTLEIPVLKDGTPGDPQPIDANLIDGWVFCGFVPTATATPTATRPVTPSPTPLTPLPATPPAGTPPAGTPPPGPPRGDVDCSGSMNAIDATLILQLEAGFLHALRCPEAGDVNRDGRTNAIDASLILQVLAGLIAALPG
jgi:hypothetical protein